MEEWREVQDYPGYSVSNLGRVKSTRTNKGREERILKPRCDRPTVSLCKNGIPTNERISRLVATAFLPNLENKLVVDHINHNPADNRLENLRWATYQENNRNRQGKVGICFVKSRGKYQAQISINNHNTFLGRYNTPEEAHAVYEAKARELHGVFFQF
jgi:hypothetical protein